MTLRGGAFANSGMLYGPSGWLIAGFGVWQVDLRPLLVQSNTQTSIKFPSVVAKSNKVLRTTTIRGGAFANSGMLYGPSGWVLAVFGVWQVDLRPLLVQSNTQTSKKFPSVVGAAN